MPDVPRIEYIEWIMGRPEAVQHDLGSSDLRGNAPMDFGLVPGHLADLPDPPEGTTLDEQVADIDDVAPENVLIVPGGTLADALVAATVVHLAGDDDDSLDGSDPSPGPKVLVEKPGYEPLYATPRAFGARVDRFRRPPETDFALDPDRVVGATTDETALVTVTNRHNPSGALTDRETLSSVADAVADADARLLVDEVYAPFVRRATAGEDEDKDEDGIQSEGEGAGKNGAVDDGVDSAVDETGSVRPFGGVTAAGLDRTVTTGSLTKFYGLGGLRVGWVVADREFVAAAARVANHFPAVATPSETLARRVFANADRLGERSRDLVERNWRALAEFVDDRDDLLGPVFDGSTYAFLAHETADGDAVTAAAADRDLLVVPGRFFERPERFRVSLGRDPERNAMALEILETTLDEI
jgi:aspartate/methionine/tyrosine aminotransferase